MLWEFCSIVQQMSIYLSGDSSLPVCVDIDDNDWNENWLNSLTEEAESVDEEEVDMPPSRPKIQAYMNR